MKVDVRLRNPELKTKDALFQRIVRSLSETCIISNRSIIEAMRKAGRPIPKLYESGIVYKNEPAGRPDELLDIPGVLAKGVGDCLHLSCWRVAELRDKGERGAGIRVTVSPHKKGARRIFHVTVRRGNGKVECPSRLLGMGKNEL